MEIAKYILFFSGLLVMLPWVIFTIRSIKFDQNLIDQFGLTITDKDRVFLVFYPDRFRDEKEDKVPKERIEVVVKWYSNEIKRSLKSSVSMFIVWIFCFVLISYF